MTPEIQAHFEAILAQVDLLKAQVLGFRQAFVSPLRETPVLEERCQGVPAELCGLQSDDAWMERGTFENPNAKRCRGCRVTV